MRAGRMTRGRIHAGRGIRRGVSKRIGKSNQAFVSKPNAIASS